MTMSVGLGKIINDPDASILTRKALGTLSTPGLLVYDDALTIDGTGRIVLKLKPDGGLQKDADGLSLTPVVEATSVTTIGIDSDVNPQAESYDREWNARLTGAAPNYFESGLAIGEEEFGGVTSISPYETVEKAKLSVTSKETQMRLRYDMENYFAARVQASGFTELFCIGEADPGLHIITGGGDSASTEGGLRLNFGTTLRRVVTFALVMNFVGGGTAGLASTFETNWNVSGSLPAGMSLTSGANVVVCSPTANPGLQVMSWSARVQSSNQLSVIISYFDVLGPLALTFNVTVFQFL